MLGKTTRGANLRTGFFFLFFIFVKKKKENGEGPFRRSKVTPPFSLMCSKNPSKLAF